LPAALPPACGLLSVLSMSNRWAADGCSSSLLPPALETVERRSLPAVSRMKSEPIPSLVVVVAVVLLRCWSWAMDSVMEGRPESHAQEHKLGWAACNRSPRSNSCTHPSGPSKHLN
jgi:hypothetical protein